ncbi:MULTISPECIES: AAA family ATPase [Streptomyces]|uniref:AAA family ATPase n=1 Tax=Streptomyces TaxID=1883 RepID=UPI0018DF8A84|nr:MULTISPECIES: AAA family ATPase [Streptomyces]MCZ4096921.1 AAA family ATPase [Streptomyces sp. H39-C1]
MTTGARAPLLAKDSGQGDPADGDRYAGRHVPAWLRETSTCFLTNPQLVLYGNIRDRYLVPDQASWRLPDVREALWWLMEPLGYRFLLVADPVDGLQVLPSGDEAVLESATALAGVSLGNGRPLSLDSLLGVVRAVAGSKDTKVGIMVDYASRLVRDVRQLSPEEHYFFAACEKLSHTSQPVRLPDRQATPRYNPVLWVANNDRDLPAWFTADSMAVRRIAVPLPDLGDRKMAAELLSQGLASQLPGGSAPDDIAYRFAEQTESLTIRSMMEIVRLARTSEGAVDSIEAAARCYRVGISDNPWSKPFLRERLNTAAERIGRRVRGQDEAIGQSVDIIIRSVMGLSGAQAASNASRPRGVLFFAGPTGVGKTELAKSLTELIFGDERAYIRFDMTEFSEEHSAARLIGAPPGYIGHDAGGELTNSVRERPFSLILFDEIEKAHPRILDKFLQILDDGRLTDSTGSTVYFSEAVLVFTSNLGMSVIDERGMPVQNVTPDDTREDLVSRISAAVKEHIAEELNRPELLNRLGDNIVVFNFIDPVAAQEIFDQLIQRICTLVEKERKVKLTLAPEARQTLLAAATADIAFGGRGIGSVLEMALINPLARALFAQGYHLAPEQCITDVARRSAGWQVTLR